MITLIGFRCTHRKVLSQEVLIDRVFFSRKGGEKGVLENRNNLLFTRLRVLILEILLWWFNGGVTPVLIPNTEVKLASGDGSLCYRRPE